MADTKLTQAEVTAAQAPVTPNVQLLQEEITAAQRPAVMNLQLLQAEVTYAVPNVVLTGSYKLQRVSQEGPGAGPVATAENINQFNIVTIVRAGNIVTATTDVPHGFQPNWRAIVSRVNDGSFNGSFLIATVPSPTTFTYGQQALDANDATGVVAGSPAFAIAPASTQTLTVSGMCKPWNSSATFNSGYRFGDEVTGLAPVSVPVAGAVTVEYLSGTTRPKHENTWTDANGGTGDHPGPTGSTLDGNGKRYPTFYLPTSELGICGLCGAFTDASGNVVQPVSIGAAGGLFTVPDGATQLQLGINDTRFDDNQGAFTVRTNAASGLIRANGKVTCRLAAGQTHTLNAGQKVNVINADDPSFDGSFIVTAVPDNATLAWDQADAGDAISGGGAVEVATSVNVAEGDRKVALFFVTRTGAWTKLSPPTTFTSYAGHRIQLTSREGPKNIVARGWAMTTAGGASFYHVKSKMYVDHNQATSITLDISDEELSGGVNVDYLLNLEVLSNAAAVANYADRMVWIGEENALPGFRSLAFDGGFDSAGQVPLGWTLDPVDGAGGSREQTDVIWGDAYKITGNGVAAVRGKITQPVFQDAWFSVNLLQRNTRYTVRARAKRSAGLIAGTLVVRLTGTLIADPGLRISASALTTNWAEYEAELLSPLGNVPSDIAFDVHLEGTPTNGEFALLDEVRILPSREKVKTSYVRVSRAGEPEAYDGARGFLLVAENNGQALRNAFVMRNFLYLVKEHSLHVTQDDGQNEARNWSIEELSSTVGTLSFQGVGLGDGFAVIASEKGAHLFRGAAITEEDRLSAEIDPTWKSINWKGAGHRAWVKVDSQRKRILFGVPMFSSKPDRILVLDYTQGFGNPVPNGGVGRKWTIWTLAANSALVYTGADRNRTFLGAADASGKVREQRDGLVTDDGLVINGYYDTAYLGDASFGRRLFGYLIAAVRGVGKLAMSAGALSGKRRKLQQRLLSDPAKRDLEIPANILDNRISFRVATSGDLGSWFHLTKLTPYLKDDPWSGEQ